MSLDLDFQLRLEERGSDRVVVSVALAPRNQPVVVEGVALQWKTTTGEPISAQLVLPIAGTVSQSMVSSVVLHAFRPIEPGCRVVATAWATNAQVESSIPTDPFTELEGHARARRTVNPDEGEREPRRLSDAERTRLAVRYPWVNEPRISKIAGELGVVDSSPSTDAMVDEVADDFELDEESAAWLKELLAEDDGPVSAD